MAGRVTGGNERGAVGQGGTAEGGAPDGTGDARLLRGERTRAKILDSAIALIVSGGVPPTIPKVAAHAGVSVGTVYYHFGRIGAVFAAAATAHLDRLSALVEPLPPHGPVKGRIGTICRWRSDLYESLGPFKRAARSSAPGARDIEEQIVVEQSVLRRQLEISFGPELRACRTPGIDLLGAIESLLSWEFWNEYRVRCFASAASAERFIADLVSWMLR